MLKWQKRKKIASGGISTFDELPKLALGCEGTIIGKAIYEGRISLKQLEQLLGNSCVKTN
jgi:phosphoribosylformimino-5-aminoimidazole carboxamide ribotide isomerase